MSAVRETVMARIYLVTVDQTTQEVSAESAAELAAQLQTLSAHARTGQLARLLWQDDHAQVTVGALSVVAIGRIVRQVWASPPLRARPPKPPSSRAAIPAVPDDDPLAIFDQFDK